MGTLQPIQPFETHKEVVNHRVVFELFLLHAPRTRHWTKPFEQRGGQMNLK